MNIKVDTHTHTCCSTHAFGTIVENAAAAARCGLQALCVTDHTPALPDAPHIWHFQTLSRLPKEIDGVKIIVGAEANLLDTDGNIDLPTDIQNNLEVIVASIHIPVYMHQTAAANTKTYLNALKNPNITILGHTGDCRFPYDIEEVAAAAAKYRKCIEINNNSCKNSNNVDNYREIIAACKRNGTYITVSSDAHTPFEIGNFEAALKLLEEADFPSDLIANLTAERFESFLSGTKKVG